MEQGPYTTLFLSSINIIETDILKILKSLDSNKAHGHNDISIRMLKLYQKSISKPLKPVLKIALELDYFLTHGKRQTLEKSKKQFTKK